MSAYIGYCFSNGAFLCADSRRVNLVDGSINSDQIHKIRRLTESVIVGTGGLGSVGHDCLDQLQTSVVNSDMINMILEKAQPIFASNYDKFISANPSYSTIPLYVMFAGYDKQVSKGFIYVLTNKDKFVTPTKLLPGTPYLTGSSTPIVVEESSKVFHELKSVEKMYKLDIWAIRSMALISSRDTNVAFPAQLWIVRENVIHNKTSMSDADIQVSKEYEVEYPAI